MRKPRKEIQLTSYNELLGIDDMVNPGTDQIMEVPLSELYPFKTILFRCRMMRRWQKLWKVFVIMVF